MPKKSFAIITALIIIKPLSKDIGLIIINAVIMAKVRVTASSSPQL
jgi:hypothetical protein